MDIFSRMTCENICFWRGSFSKKNPSLSSKRVSPPQFSPENVRYSLNIILPLPLEGVWVRKLDFLPYFHIKSSFKQLLLKEKNLLVPIKLFQIPIQLWLRARSCLTRSYMRRFTPFLAPVIHVEWVKSFIIKPLRKKFFVKRTSHLYHLFCILVKCAKYWLRL
jgi:hypothetical protein